MILPTLLIFTIGAIGLIFYFLGIWSLSFAIKQGNIKEIWHSLKSIVLLLILSVVAYIPSLIMFFVKSLIEKRWKSKMNAFYNISIIFALVVIITLIILNIEGYFGIRVG